MSYMHIPNLYKARAILAFRQCYAMEKIHGTSAAVRFCAKVFHAKLKAALVSQ